MTNFNNFGSFQSQSAALLNGLAQIADGVARVTNGVEQVAEGLRRMEQALRQDEDPIEVDGETDGESGEEEEEPSIEVCLYNVPNRNPVTPGDACNLLQRMLFHGINRRDIVVKHGKTKPGMRPGISLLMIEVSGGTKTILEEFATSEMYMGEMHNKNYTAFRRDYSKYMQILCSIRRPQIALCAYMAELDREFRRRGATNVKYTPTSVRWKYDGEPQHTMTLQELFQSTYIDVARIAYSNLNEIGKKEMRKHGRRHNFNFTNNNGRRLHNSSSA